MGIFFSLLGAALYSLASIFAKQGQKDYPQDDGALLTALSNVLLLGLASGVLMLTDPPVWNGPGVAVFLLAGVATTGLGRLTLLAAVRAIGPSRATLYKVSAPLFTLIVAYAGLGERLQPLELVGAAAVLAGLWLLTRDTQSASLEGNPGGPKGVSLSPGVLYGLASAACFGIGYVFRKWGLSFMPSALLGACIGSVSGCAVAFGTACAGRGWRNTIETGIRGVPHWYWLSGLAMSLALLAQFEAFKRLSASVTSVLFSTEPLWTLLLGYAFLRGQESLTPQVLVSAAIIVAGAVLLVMG